LEAQSPLRLLIVGSCVSRDILNFVSAAQFALADYYARSSLASLATAAIEAEAHDMLAAIESPFQRRMVARDFHKSILQELKSQRFDLLLLDLIEERFDLYEMRPGSLVTVSSELFSSGLIPASERASGKWISSGSRQHRAYWLQGLEKLFAQLDAIGLQDRVIVNRVFWAERFADGSPLPSCFAPAAIAQANDCLAWMYGELERLVAPQRWLRFTEAMLRSSRQHRWGVAPYHYGDAYYLGARDALLGISGNADQRK
jgi:hypothetical protein